MPETAAAKKTKTSYVVLMLVEHDGADGAKTAGWMTVGPPVEASSATAAVRAKAPLEGSRQLVAVPSSSWKPVKVTTETKTVLKLE
jgi:hypothetical protein